MALVQHQPTDAAQAEIVAAEVEVPVAQSDQNEARSAVFVLLGGSFATAVAMIGLHRLNQFDSRAIVAHFSAVATMFCTAAVLLFPTTHTAVHISIRTSC